MPQSKFNLSFIRVMEWREALELLRIRNECREGMTHNRGYITEKDQWQFFTDHLSPVTGDGKYEAYLLETDIESVGYGLLKWDEELNRYWMTAGLANKYRGRGLSRFLINLITQWGNREGAEVWIDVWEDNLALIGDIKVGYEIKDQQLPEGPMGRVLNVMRYNPDRVIRRTEQESLKRFGKTSNDMVTEMEEVDKISREVYK